MDDIGADGQQKLLQSSVLVVGAGGLASPALQYLAAAGIGTIGLIDDDIVERSNLQRQTIHSTNTIDDLKVESAASYLEDLNPNLTYNTYDETIDQDNAISIIDEYDFVLDCSDNFPTRFLINDACQLTQTPFSNAAIYQFEGQAITVPPTDDFPCY
ncbi:MAG: ThiF family adenylyltransferase, partial [Halobacteriaceae archaeon]